MKKHILLFEDMAGASYSQITNQGQNDARQTENRAEIKAVASKNSNYVYHMLSVSKCGYDNEYGRTNNSFHTEKDLQILKNHERHLTVAGGEHTGKLYFLCAALPASLDDEILVSNYYKALADLFGAGEIEQNFKTYQMIYEQSFSSIEDVNLDTFRRFYSNYEAMKKEIAEIADVMYRNYEIYSEKVWKTSLAELSVVVAELNKEFAKNDFAGKWEDALNCQYRHGVFKAVMCNSMENGVQAIDISNTKDVFCFSGDYLSMANFISHEFGIYLLKDLLADTSAFQSNSTYQLTEALAEYYNLVIAGRHHGNWNSKYIDFYRRLREREPKISAKEMFLRAVDYYMPA